jgi:hypothetical protein
LSGKPVKLPRKRKKAMIKAEGYGEYIASIIVSEILIKDAPPEREAFLRKFPRTGYVKFQKYHVTSWW